MNLMATAQTWVASATLAAGSEEHNPLLPDPAEILWGLVAFAVLFFLLVKFAFPTFERLHEERVEAIEGGIKRAEEAQREAEQLRSEYRLSLQQAKNEAAQLRTQAQAERAQIIEQARAEAHEVAQQEAERTHQRLEADIAATRQALIDEVGALAVGLANRVVGENLADTQVTQRTVDRFLEELETQIQTQPTASGTQSATPGSGL